MAWAAELSHTGNVRADVRVHGLRRRERAWRHGSHQSHHGLRARVVEVPLVQLLHHRFLLLHSLLVPTEAGKQPNNRVCDSIFSVLK